MNVPTMFAPQPVRPLTTLLPAYLPVPGFGVLPVNAYVIAGAEPLLVDTGLAALREQFMTALRSTIALEELKWIWLTHVDADHAGNLAAVLNEAPQARVITTFLGMGKMGMHGLPLDRVYLLNPGQSLALADRELTAFVPPSFDAPETTGFFDAASRTLFSSDCFGALLESPAVEAAQIAAPALREGMVAWAVVDAPWLIDLQPARFAATLDTVRRFAADAVLGSHLPPAADLTEVLLSHLADARTARRFEGPDQAALERAMDSLRAA